MKAKKIVADLIAKTAIKSAKAACGAASYYGVHQPKEPTNIKSRIK